MPILCGRARGVLSPSASSPRSPSACPAGLVERARFGATDTETLARVEAELRARFDADAAMLAGIANPTAAARRHSRRASLDPTDNGGCSSSPRRRCRPIRRAVSASPSTTPRVSPSRGRAVSPISEEPHHRPACARHGAGRAWAAARPRRTRQPERARRRAGARRHGRRRAVARGSAADAGPADTAVVPTSIVPVTVHTPFATRDGVPDLRPPATSRSTSWRLSGAVLVDAEVARQDVAFMRVPLRNRVWALGARHLCATLLLAIGPLLDAGGVARRRPSMSG